MTAAAPARRLRAAASRLPLFERRRRMALVHKTPAVVVLRAVLAAGLGEEWDSASDFAERVLVVAPRTLRRWLAGTDEVPLAIEKKVGRLAFAFGLDMAEFHDAGGQ